MKRLALALALMASTVGAQEFSSRQLREFHNALTGAGRFGAPGYTTVLLPTCDAANARAIAWDSTALTLKVCNGTSYTAIGAVAVGGAITGGTNNTVLYIDNTGLLGSEAALGYVASTDTLTAVNTSFANITITNGTLLGSGASIVIGAGNNDGAFKFSTANTPDTPQIVTGPTSNSWHVEEFGDIGVDFNNGRCGTAACTNPSLIVHSPDQVVTEYTQVSTDATGAGKVQSNLAEVTVGGSKTAITEASAQSIISVGIPTSTNVYSMTVTYSVYDINGANYVTRGGHVTVQGGNSGGTATCTINTTQDAEGEDGSQIATSNAATLTYTWTNVASTTNCVLSLNAASSEGANTYGITWTAQVNGNSSAITVTPQ